LGLRKTLFKRFTDTTTLSNYSIILLVFSVYIMHLWIMWPGALNPDSRHQYTMAISGIYTDHHPPLMSFVWRCLNYIIPSHGSLFLLQLFLFYAAIFYLIKSVKNFRFRFLFILLPLIPQISAYLNMIWKDANFAFSFLLVAAYLAYVTLNRIKPTWYQIALLLTILLYGTAVKFQAKYCVPILLGWITYIITDKSILNQKFFKIFISLTFIFYLLLNIINFILVPNEQKDHSWQYVKIYDLAAISIATHQDLLPDFIKTELFSTEDLYLRASSCKSLTNCKYSQYNVDNFVFGVTPILKKSNIEQERKKLYSIWLNSVLNHPIIYLKHRCIVIIGILLGTPIEYKNIANLFANNHYLFLTANIFIYLVFSNLIFNILSVIYFIFGIITLYKQKGTNLLAIPIICFNAISLIMLLVLFFCSMASTPRYVYINACMVNSSHIFVYLCLKKKRKELTTTS